MSVSLRKKAAPTATTRAHRFEPFSRKIAKIKIDPVHTVQKSRISDNHNDLSKSFFRSALDEWAELNLTTTFTSFLNKASPLTESLPQLLHHADAVFDILQEHIERKDEVALEPLLSLLAHLAHDLGQRFTRYFERTVRLVLAVSAVVEDPETIESCFTCLAWMFKYMSRSLVQDLQPLLSIMIPHMYARKEYLRRFAAESLAFLIRKAAVLYQRQQQPLRLALTYLFERFEQTSQVAENSAYEQALMRLLTESTIGVEAKLHSATPNVFQCATQIISEDLDLRAAQCSAAVLQGCTVALIHQTNAAGFQPLLDVIIRGAKNSLATGTLQSDVFPKLFLASIATRKGSRIGKWSETIDLLVMLLTQVPDNQSHDDILVYCSISASTIQYAPMDQLLPYLTRLLDLITTKLTRTGFFAFCETVARLGQQRFHDLVLPQLQQYIVAQWQNDEAGLCYLLHQLHGKGLISPIMGNPGYLKGTNAWDRHIISQLTNTAASSGLSEKVAFYFRLIQSTHVARDSTNLTDMLDVLSATITGVLKRKQVDFSSPIRLTLGWALEACLKLSMITTPELWNAMINEQREAFYMKPFLQSCASMAAVIKHDAAQEADLNHATELLIANMLGSSVEMKQVSLQVLRGIGDLTGNTWLIETCDLLLDLVSIPYLPSNARQVAMLLRRLPSRQKNIDSSSPFFNLVPLVSMGLLQNYHDQPRRDLCEAIRVMVTNGAGEETILHTALEWLHAPGMVDAPLKTTVDDQKATRLSEFECSNLRLITSLSNDILSRHKNAAALLAADFEGEHELHPPRTPTENRSLALQVLLEVPETVERRSRLLVPIFLSMASGKTNAHIPRSDDSVSSHTVSPDTDDDLWRLKDRRMFLQLFSKFMNPRVLYRSDEVYSMIMELLTNGNSEIRKLALLTILNWKEPTLKQYQDVLLRVAEEKSATSELATLLSRNDESAAVKLMDRPAVLPALLRLIFGQLIGRSSSHGSQEAKRKTILRLLFRMDHGEILSFLEIALGRLAVVSLMEDGTFPTDILSTELVSDDQQYGFLRMILSVMEVLQSQFAPYGKEVISAVLYCTARASQQANMYQDAVIRASALTKNIRRAGLQCLTALFKECSGLDWAPYLPVMFANVVTPRLNTFAIDTAQGVSGLLQLFSSWTSSPGLFHILLDYNSQLLSTIWTIISEEVVRDEVRIFVIEKLIIPLTEELSTDSTQTTTATTILRQEVDRILDAFAIVLSRQPSKGVLESITRVIPAIAPIATEVESVTQALTVLISLLCQPNQKLQPHVRSSLLAAVNSILATKFGNTSAASRDELFEVVAGYYNYFKDAPNRSLVGRTLATLSQSDAETLHSVEICSDLNAASSTQLLEIDYEKRLTAFSAIGEFDLSTMSRQQLLPIVHNLIYFARTADDFSIRSSAVTCLKRYVVKASAMVSCPAHALVYGTLLPAFRKGSRDDSEVVRADFVYLFGLLVKHLDGAEELQDMRILLVGDDDEASFFSNILHIQQHRRLRALRRLVQEVERGHIKPANVEGYFLPLIDKFVHDGDGDESTSGMKGSSIAAISDLLKWVDWKVFRRVFRQYKQELESSSRSEKDSIKLLNNAADALTDVIGAQDGAHEVKPHLCFTLPSMSVLWDELKANFIPSLAKFIHHRDEAEMSLRLPASKVAIKLINLLPEEQIPSFASPILLDISQILRSRTQESRDVARNTLADIVHLLGPSSVQFVLKELRSTLTRGYQLHVLSFTMHTILLTSSGGWEPGDLDYCIEDLTAVIMDDIFGSVGQEKESQDYISSMKEVKRNKSFDTMELLAKSASVSAFGKLIKPFQSLLAGSLSAKQTRQVDDLLRRLGVGISHNTEASSQNLLIFAYEMIQAFYKEKVTAPPPILTNDQVNRQRYLIQLDSASKSTDRTATSLLYKLARFALDIVRSTLLKYPLLLTAENVHGFLPIIGDAIVQGQEDVKISAFRLLSIVIKLPLEELDQNASLYVMEAVKVVKASVSTSEESSQAALKLVTAVLRDRKLVEVRDSDIAYLLHKTLPDIEEPDRQGVTFNFVKSVMARQYQLPEIYEIVDKIGIMMVTNQSQNARDSARGVYVHFILDYPQSEKRWSKQLKFLVKNLDYQHPEGRQSVMEAVFTLLQKMDKNTAKELVSSFFVPVILRMANDDNLECRQMGGVLLSQLYRKSDEVQLKSLLHPLRSWLEQTEKTNLTKLSLQGWVLFFEANLPGAQEEIPTIRTAMLRILQNEQGIDAWELHFHALELLLRLTTNHQAMVMTSKQRELWASALSHLKSHHAWVQGSASNLLATFLQDCTPGGSEETNKSLQSSHGLRINTEMILTILRGCVKILKLNMDSTELAAKNMKNLLLLAMTCHEKGLTMQVKATSLFDTEGDLEDVHDFSGSDHGLETTSISTTQYLADQMTSVIRREPNKFTSSGFLPRLSALQTLTALTSQLPETSLPATSITKLLIPLAYITAPETKQPRSADATFEETYKTYVELAQLLLESLQSKLGDGLYVRLMTDASKVMRQRRDERRQKRVIERVVEPEKAARDKRRKFERKKDRKKEIKDIYRKGRRKDLGF